MLLWVALLMAIGGVVLVELLALARQRRLFLRDPQRRRYFIRYAQQRLPDIPPAAARSGSLADAEATPRSLFQPSPAPISAEAEPGRATKGGPEEAVVYVDAQGQCTFANRAARELLRWEGGNLALRDVLAGGSPESDALLASLARRGLIEEHRSALAGPTRAPLDISAVAVRDRDDNLWGAALFIRRRVSAAET
jgi:PAS domain-containing protein